MFIAAPKEVLFALRVDRAAHQQVQTWNVEAHAHRVLAGDQCGDRTLDGQPGVQGTAGQLIQIDLTFDLLNHRVAGTEERGDLLAMFTLEDQRAGGLALADRIERRKFAAGDPREQLVGQLGLRALLERDFA